MNDVGSLARESMKSLGAGAYLVSVLPTVVLILTLFALITSRLYPWSSPLETEQGPVEPGFDSVVQSAQELGVAGGVVFALVILVCALLLRPLQISAVQFVEGYWSELGRRGVVEAFGVERHARRRRAAQVRSAMTIDGAADATFGEVAMFGRRQFQQERRMRHAEAVLSRYPPATDTLLPTLLGNVLRRAETTSGERYGLSTVVVYPRLYPYLSRRLDTEVANQLDLIDSAATFVILLSVQAIVSSPLIFRHDRWSLVPLAFVLVAWVSYRGATSAAGRYGQLLSTAFDLHRFDMLTALHRKLPVDAEEEYTENEKLSDFLAAGEPLPDIQRHDWVYEHPPPVGGTLSPEPTVMPRGEERRPTDGGSLTTGEHDLATGTENVNDDRG